MLVTAEESGTSSLGKFTCGLLHMDTPVLAENTSINQLCEDTECHLENLPRVMDDPGGW